MNDPRDRLQVEYTSLRFLRNNGVKCVPHPIAVDPDHGCVIYDYVPGHEISEETITELHIDSATEFLFQLKKLRDAAGSELLSPASEACFSIKAIVENIKFRLAKLGSISKKGLEYQVLHPFLENELVPSFRTIVQSCISRSEEARIPFFTEISRQERTLSPSDFGFHNARRRPDGQIVFLDFEYFGWDDPAKTICDFLLHPAISLTDPHKRRFLKSMLQIFKDIWLLENRVEIVYTLFGLKWCTILLNEFVTDDLSRREFAGGEMTDKRNLLTSQLAKAREMLQVTWRNYEDFPYHDLSAP
jgi:hypothetical protein